MGMKHAEEQIALQAIDFWATVCEIELEIHYDNLEAQEYGETPEQENKYFAKIALPEIAPVLLDLLLRQDEDADEDDKGGREDSDEGGGPWDSGENGGSGDEDARGDGDEDQDGDLGENEHNIDDMYTDY